MTKDTGIVKRLAQKTLAGARRIRAVFNNEEGIDFRQQSIINYRQHVQRLLAELPKDEALIRAIGANSKRDFDAFGDAQVDVLQANGLLNGMSIYDIGCGSGRTAQALVRRDWQGTYQGHDIVPELVEQLRVKCPPGFEVKTHTDLSLLAPRNSLDMVFHWSVFTHLLPEECFVYLKDIHRRLKTGGRLLFSFLELDDQRHWQLFLERADRIEQKDIIPLLDTFLHRDWINTWAREIGFNAPIYTGGKDSRNHPAFWQSLARMDRIG